MKKGILFTLLCIVTLGLSAQTKSEKAYEQTKELIVSGNYFFEANKALPTTGSSVSLVTNRGYLKLKDEQLTIYLPYFGEMYLGGGYNGGGPIAVTKGKVHDYNIKFNDKKHRLIITFKVKNSSERFDVTMNVDRLGWTSIIVKSMDRSTISYYGKTRVLKTNMVSSK
ncbi:MAG: hypothetical protein COA50_10570 [Flavobacteriaceae bacterium]|nr:MAG: hypothetical protein COA50_10570 [Flavobacteriaceae bacterium]